MKKDELREARERLGMTQGEFSDFIGVSRSYLSKVEAGIMTLSDKMERKVLRVLSKKVPQLNFSEQFGRENFSVGNINANAPVTVLGNGAKTKNVPMRSNQNEVAPAWAKELIEHVSTTNALLLKILERMG